MTSTHTFLLQWILDQTNPASLWTSNGVETLKKWPFTRQWMPQWPRGCCPDLATKLTRIPAYSAASRQTRINVSSHIYLQHTACFKAYFTFMALSKYIRCVRGWKKKSDSLLGTYREPQTKVLIDISVAETARFRSFSSVKGSVINKGLVFLVPPWPPKLRPHLGRANKHIYCTSEWALSAKHFTDWLQQTRLQQTLAVWKRRRDKSSRSTCGLEFKQDLFLSTGQDLPMSTQMLVINIFRG